jgi:UrcA family protein
MRALITCTNLPRLITTAIFGALALSCGAVCAAADSTHAPAVTVRYGDLDVSRPQNVAELYQRIVAAAYDVCKGSDFDHNLNESLRQPVVCVDEAIANAVKRLGLPKLVAIYNAHHRQPLPISVAQTR